VTVLLVEDERDIRMIARVSLQQLGGFTVIEAASGAEALDIVSRVLPDVILLDVMMPGMDGTGVLRALQRVPATAAVPVIFLTAKAMPAEHDRLRALGARAIVTKPFDPAALPHLVRQALAGGRDSGQAPSSLAGVSRAIPGPGTADIDAGALQQLDGFVGEQGGDLVSELIAMFASHTPQSIRQLRDAASGLGADDAERLAHSLKGSASELGATGIADLARAVEHLARDGRSGEIRPLVDEIDALLEPTLEHLRRGRRV